MFDRSKLTNEVKDMNTGLKTIAVVAVGMLTVGCASTKALDADVAALKTQVGSLQSEVDTLKRGATSTAQSAADAQRAAQTASTKADQALAAAQAADRKVDATSESMTRMFAKSVSK
jgi:hypothetical protein